MTDNDEAGGILGQFDKVLTWVSLVLGGLTLIFMTAFSCWNVLIMRKALNNPIVGAEDLLLLSLVVIVALSVPFGARTGAHIEIEVLESSMSAAFAKWSLVVMKVLVFAMLIVMAWRLWHAGGTAAKFGETTQQLLISFGPFYYLLAVSIGLYAVVVVFDIINLIRHGKITTLKVKGEVV